MTVSYRIVSYPYPPTYPTLPYPTLPYLNAEQVPVGRFITGVGELRGYARLQLQLSSHARGRHHVGHHAVAAGAVLDQTRQDLLLVLAILLNIINFGNGNPFKYYGV